MSSGYLTRVEAATQQAAAAAVAAAAAAARHLVSKTGICEKGVFECMKAKRCEQRRGGGLPHPSFLPCMPPFHPALPVLSCAPPPLVSTTVPPPLCLLHNRGPPYFTHQQATTDLTCATKKAQPPTPTPTQKNVGL